METRTGMEKDTTIAITYESLYEILIREKQREPLQQLDPEFWRHTLAYLREKHAMLEASRKKVDIFSATERENILQQIRNIKRILQEVYDRREKKLVEIALNKSRTGSAIIDTGNMLDVEQQFFDSLVNEMALFRQGLLKNILDLREPSLWLDEGHEEAPAVRDPAIPEGMAHVRMIRHVPQFIGKELEAYGPYKEGDTAILPKDIAEVLVRKEDAQWQSNASDHGPFSAPLDQSSSMADQAPNVAMTSQE